MPSNKIDILRKRAEALDNSSKQQPDTVRNSYDALVALTPDTKKEKLLVAEALERNKKKIIDTKLMQLQTLEEKIQQVSTLDIGDHIGATATASVDVAKDLTVAAAQYVDPAIKAVSAGADQVSDGANATMDFVRTHFAKQSASHPRRTAVLSALGGVMAAYALVKTYQWITEEKATPARKVLRGLGAGTVVAGTLALLGIHKNVLPKIASPVASVMPNAPAKAPKAPLDIRAVPVGTDILPMPIIVNGKAVQYYTKSATEKGFTIGADAYEIQSKGVILGATALQRIERVPGGVQVVGGIAFLQKKSFITDAELSRVLTEIDGKPQSTVHIAYTDKSGSPQTLEIEFKKV